MALLRKIAKRKTQEDSVIKNVSQLHMVGITSGKFINCFDVDVDILMK